MRRAYQTLLRLYPVDYRIQFAAAMLHTFSTADQERRAQRSPARARFLLTEFHGLITGAASEWIAKLTIDPSVRGRGLPDVRMMRPPGVPREKWFAQPGIDYFENERCS